MRQGNLGLKPIKEALVKSFCCHELELHVNYVNSFDGYLPHFKLKFIIISDVFFFFQIKAYV